MAYANYTISSMSEIPALVGAFAANVGFTVNNANPNAPIVRRADDANALSFQLSYSEASPTTGINANTYYRRLTWACTNASVGANPAYLDSPRLASGSATPTVPGPSQVHLFGSATPEPYMAIVVEFGFNRFRHLYLGHMERVGGYTGGEIISGSQIGSGYQGNYNNVAGAYHDYQASLFQGEQNWSTNNGGARIVHANNATTWRRFYKNTTWTSTIDSAFSADGASMIHGGYFDIPNYGNMMIAKAPYSGQVMLAPINLYIGQRPGGFQRFQFVGYPPGIRLVHMEELNPAQEISVGTDTWMVFPVFRKNVDPAMSSTAAVSPYWPGEESSHYRGYAYLKG